MRRQNSDYIFYADESGDHSLSSIDREYPIFSLSLCAFKKSTYCSRVVPSFQRLKFDYFGHDAIVLHEHDIRKQKAPFDILTDTQVRMSFLSDLSACVHKAPFRILGCVISKPDLTLDLFPDNPYAIGLKICLQKAYFLLEKAGNKGCETHFIFEVRGRKEDRELELEFRRIVSGANDLRMPFPGFNLHFADKKSNSTGMQIADLTARPLGIRVLRPEQRNRVYDTIARKVFRGRKFSAPKRGIHA